MKRLFALLLLAPSVANASSTDDFLQQYNQQLQIRNEVSRQMENARNEAIRQERLQEALRPEPIPYPQPRFEPKRYDPLYEGRRDF